MVCNNNVPTWKEYHNRNELFWDDPRFRVRQPKRAHRGNFPAFCDIKWSPLSLHYPGILLPASSYCTLLRFVEMSPRAVVALQQSR